MAFDLGALLKDVSNSDTGREQIEYIRLDLIDEDPNNFYQLSDIDNLAANIELCGLQQPIRVRPVPGTDRYMIVSGHRRRKALELLAQDAPERWNEAPCIVETDEASPALQQLRLIYANSNTRKMSSAEISEQAVQVEKLLYQLKEDGYEFPGRMRDHVAEAVGASKTKLARLKVIRENLSSLWQPSWKEGKLGESVAYELAQLVPYYQYLIFAATDNINCLYAGTVQEYGKRFLAIDEARCGPEKDMVCTHKVTMLEKSCKDRWSDPCRSRCCMTCASLTSCKSSCEKAAGLKAQKKADAKAVNNAAREAQAKKDAPVIAKISELWQRFGLARELAHKEISDTKEILRYLLPSTDEVMRLECGEAKITPTTKLPYCSYLAEVGCLVQLADLLDCSLDFLLCRTDIREMAQPDGAVSELDTGAEAPVISSGGWYPVAVEPPVGVDLVLIDSGGYAGAGKYLGSDQFTMDYGDPVILWTLMPRENDVLQSTPAVIGWHVGNPGAYGNYVAYVQFSEGSKKALRELLWTGDEWLMFGETLADDVIVCCWTEQPEL